MVSKSGWFDKFPAEPRRGLRDVAALALPTAGTALAVVVLIRILRYHVALAELLGFGWPVLVASLVAAALLGAAAVVRVARRGPTSGLPRLVLAVAFLHFVVFHAALQPYRRLVFDVSVALAFGLLALGVVVGPAIARRVPRRITAAAGLVLVNLALCVLLAEAGLRIVGLVVTSPLLAQGTERAEMRIDRYRYAPGTIRYGFPVNSRGFYDEEPRPRDPGIPLVASIGDSFAAGVVPHHYHFTTVIERELPGVRVENLGVPATGPPEYRYLLEYEALPLRPDVVLVNLFVGNDVATRPPARTAGAGLHSWYDRSSLLVFLVPKRLLSVARERRAVRASGEGPRGDDAASGSGRAEGPEAIARAFPWVVDPSLERAFLSEEGMLEIALRTAREGWLAGEEGYRALFSAIDAMVETAQETPLVFAILPDRVQLDDDLWERVVRREPELAGRRDFPQQVLQRGLSERGLAVLDLLPILRAEPPLADGARHVYHRMDTHFNARGNRVAGEAMARFLSPYFLFPSREDE